MFKAIVNSGALGVVAGVVLQYVFRPVDYVVNKALAVYHALRGK